MGVNRFQQPLGEPGKLRVEFQMDPRGEERKPFQEPFDIGVLADLLGVFVQGQAARDFGKFTREFARHFPQMTQLVIIMIKQPFVHRPNLPLHTARSPNRSSS